MGYETETLGTLLSDPRISRIAADAIRNRNLKEEPLWDRTPDQVKTEQFLTSNIARGMERLYRAAETGGRSVPGTGRKGSAGRWGSANMRTGSSG